MPSDVLRFFTLEFASARLMSVREMRMSSALQVERRSAGMEFHLSREEQVSRDTFFWVESSRDVVGDVIELTPAPE